jgi:tetratricopeptide (TPR) repeat protein
MDFTLALKDDPEDVQALTERGNLLHAIGNDSDAVWDYDEALSVCDTCTWLLYNKALALRSAGRLRETVVVLEALVAVNGDDDEAWLMLGDCRFEQGALRPACRAWQRSAWLGNPEAGGRLEQHCGTP